MPLAGSFVVNIGELLELATNGYLRATVHRVVSPPAQQQRLSIAFFLGAQLDARWCRFTPCRPSWRVKREGPDSDPHNPLLRDVGWNYLKGPSCVPIRTWRNATIRTCFANAPSN